MKPAREQAHSLRMLLVGARECLGGVHSDLCNELVACVEADRAEAAEEARTATQAEERKFASDFWSHAVKAVAVEAIKAERVRCLAICGDPKTGNSAGMILEAIAGGGEP